MLSRIAESLYWLGRYVERADDTARILDVYVHQLLEGALVDEDLACRSLLATMGATPPAAGRALDVRWVTERLAYDEAGTCSIAASLAAARTNARGVAEAISSELWEALNSTYNALPAQVAQGRAGGPSSFFRFVRERSAVIAGLAEHTMSHDDAWRFLVIGRSLERVDMLSRLLTTGLEVLDDEQVEWVVLLRSCSAHEAYLRTYRREVEPALAAQFLVLDRLFPRSILRALTEAERCLGELDPSPSRAGVTDEARREVGRVRTDLEYGDPALLVGDLGAQLRVVQRACSAASAALAERYFRSGAAVVWSGGEPVASDRAGVAP
ncbi:MAG TPA: alpha-E domain-containing protein [Acidimicrobiales bacterium]|nr:alpha-E domain-containing protein [Acidimicrobiales bacterium]